MVRALVVQCVLMLLGTAAASIAETVAGSRHVLWGPSPNATAIFGAADVNRSEQVRGMIMFQLGGVLGKFQAVNWTTNGLTIPTSLIRQVCGDTPEMPTFTYSINEKWAHGRRAHSAQGAELCAERFTGRHWDPTAACGPQSGNKACGECGDLSASYRCNNETFDPAPDASGSFAYSFLNEDACELGDLSGMSGELEASGTIDCIDLDPACEEWAEGGECERNPDHMMLFCQKSCGACGTGEKLPQDHVPLRSLRSETAGMAQLSAPFGEIQRASVVGSLIGINCDASGPPAVHGTNCDCLKFGGRKSPSIGTLTVFRPLVRETFHLAGGPYLPTLKGRSVVVQCGPSFGEEQGRPLFCAALL